MTTANSALPSMDTVQERPMYLSMPSALLPMRIRVTSIRRTFGAGPVEDSIWAGAAGRPPWPL